jgi:hypothetical protein
MKQVIFKLSVVIAAFTVIFAGLFYYFGSGSNFLSGSLQAVQSLGVQMAPEAEAGSEAAFSSTEVIKAYIEGDNLVYRFRSPLNTDILDKYAFLVLDEESEKAIIEPVFYQITAVSGNEADVKKVNKENGLKSYLYTFSKSQKIGQVAISDIKMKLGYDAVKPLKVVLIPFMLKNGTFLMGSRGENVVLEM